MNESHFDDNLVVERQLERYVVVDQEPIRHALRKFEENEEGLAICVDSGGVLLGVLTDGDFRRWAMAATLPDLGQPVGDIINRNMVAARVGDSKKRIAGLFDRRVKFVPLTDSRGRCVAVIRPRRPVLRFANHTIGSGEACFIIAEIGNNHNGSPELALRLVDEAVRAGADCAKFQLRDLTTLYANKGHANDASEDLGSQYTLDLLSRFQLSKDDLFRTFDYCRSKGITPLCTPWDAASFEALEKYGMEAYKVASADFVNHDLLGLMAASGKPLICSTGMCTDSEIRESVALLRAAGTQYALLHCNSTYPAPFKDLNLRYMDRLREVGACPIGYSSHDRGINVAVAAVTLGASIIEKHFTLDRGMEGNDHRVSLLPSEFAEMVEGIRQVEEALGDGTVRLPSQGEIMNRESLGKSLFINVPLERGAVIEEHMLEARSPGRGLQPNRKSALVGKAAVRALRPGDILFPSDLGEQHAKPRDYVFRRPFGIPIRYHDLNTLGRMANFDLLEFHLSYKDLTEDLTKYFDRPWDLDLVVHAPELFENDHVLDLCSLDAEYRTRSIANLRRVTEVTQRLKEWFPRASRPKIVINAGGFTQDAPLSKSARSERYEMILESLEQVDLTDLEVIPQTMPPFPWHFGGQRFQNLFVDPEETVAFCTASGRRVCLDTSHSKLACNHFHWAFSDFVEKVGPHTAHMHIADAAGVDGEGLQIGEGEIDLPSLARSLNQVTPRASFIPEIWQGHKNSGEGFWRALELLETHL